MKKIITLTSVILLAVALVLIFTVDSPKKITNFEECVAAGNPVMESYPRQCRAGNKTFTEEILMTRQEAYSIAIRSKCASIGRVTETAVYNNYTKTWWFTLLPYTPKKGCSPACVVSEQARTADVNWRCTGLLN